MRLEKVIKHLNRSWLEMSMCNVENYSGRPLLSFLSIQFCLLFPLIGVGGGGKSACYFFFMLFYMYPLFFYFFYHPNISQDLSHHVRPLGKQKIVELILQEETPTFAINSLLPPTPSTINNLFQIIIACVVRIEN